MTKHEAITKGEIAGRSEWQLTADKTGPLAMQREDVKRFAEQTASAMEPAGPRAVRFAYVEAFVTSYMREWQKAYNDQPAVREQRLKEMVERRIQSLIDGWNRDTRDHFVTSLDADPAYTFEWADNAIRYAVHRGVGLRLKAILEHPEGGVRAVINEAKDSALRGARWPSQSTSALTNFCKLQETAAYADFVSEVEHYL